MDSRNRRRRERGKERRTKERGRKRARDREKGKGDLIETLAQGDLTAIGVGELDVGVTCSLSLKTTRNNWPVSGGGSLTQLP